MIAMPHDATPAAWRRILNAILAGTSGLIASDLVWAWGVFFGLFQNGSLSASTFPGMRAVCYTAGLVVAVCLIRWQWKRSAHASTMQEKLMTGAWLVLCILLLVRPRFTAGG